MLEFDINGRIKYNPELHPNQGKPWSYEDIRYLVDWLEIIGYEEMSLALGRTENTLITKVFRLRKLGIMKGNDNSVRHIRLLRRSEDKTI